MALNRDDQSDLRRIDRQEPRARHSALRPNKIPASKEGRVIELLFAYRFNGDSSSFCNRYSLVLDENRSSG
jgi:hypothetical protein